MEFEQEFERDFLRRTLDLVKQYDGPYDATLLLNCLLGLLIVPKESSIEKIPEDPVDQLSRWGISPSSIRAFGAITNNSPRPDTLRGIVWNLRNAVAHFRFEPRHHQRRVTGFGFTDRSGFHAEIEIAEIRDFVERLANHLESQVAG